MEKPAIKLFITDEGYRAIGHVAAQWAYLETELDDLLTIFLSQEKVKKLNLKKTQSFKQRMGNLKEAARALLEDHDGVYQEIIDVITDASSLRNFRDDIVHGRWRLIRKGENLFPGIESIKSFPAYKYREMKFTYQKAEDIAAKISKVTVRVINWRTKYVSA